MQMTRIRLFRHGKVVGIGQVGMCRHIGDALDLLLTGGYKVQMERFDPDKHPISNEMREGFLEACAEVNRIEKFHTNVAVGKFAQQTS